MRLFKSIDPRLRTDASVSVEVRGIALYALWHRQHAPTVQNHQFPHNIFGTDSYIGLWRATRLVWMPAPTGKEESWVQPKDINTAFTELQRQLQQIASAHPIEITIAKQPVKLSYWTLHPKAFLEELLRGNSPLRAHQSVRQTQPLIPAYLILFVEEFRPSIPTFEQSLNGKQNDIPRQRVIDVQTSVVEGILHSLHLSEIDPQNQLPLIHLSHYDLRSQRRGTIVVGPKRALVAGVNAGEVSTLANLIQPRDTDSSMYQGGILPQYYDDVIDRIRQWNVMGDISETTYQTAYFLTQTYILVKDSKNSTNGQLWLNFALATIGVLLALSTSPHLNYWQTGSLALLAIASIMYAFYASYGTFYWQVLGWILTFVAVIIALAPLWLCWIFHVCY